MRARAASIAAMLPARPTTIRAACASCSRGSRWARVTVGEEVVGEIGPGLLALVGVAAGDAVEDAALLARKTVRLRVLAGDERPLFRSLLDVPGAALLCVSQFTLLADVAPRQPALVVGRRAPEAAAPLVEARGRGGGRGRPGSTRPLRRRHGREPRERRPVTLVLDSAELRALVLTRLTLPRARRGFPRVAANRPALARVDDLAAEGAPRSSAAGRSSTAK